jgi:hypothetical protein
MIRLLRKVIDRLSYLLKEEPPKVSKFAELPSLSEEELHWIHKQFPRPKFFIMGHARSGTTLLGRLIRIHPEVHCDWQMQFFSQRGMIPDVLSSQFQGWLNHRSNHWTADKNPTTIMLRMFSDYLMEGKAEAVGKWVVGDKSVNGNGSEAIDWAGKIYPDAYLVYIIRDGRDTVLSKRVQLFLDQPQFLQPDDQRILDHLKNKPAEFLNSDRSIFTDTWLRDASEKWGRDVSKSVEIGSKIFGDRFLAVRYEDILSNPDKWLHRIWTLFNVDIPSRGLVRELHDELAQNPAADWHQSLGLKFVEELPRGVHGGWKQIYTESDIEIFMHNAGEQLQEWGYV